MFFIHLLFEKDADITLLILELFIGNSIGDRIEPIVPLIVNNYAQKLDMKLRLSESKTIQDSINKSKYKMEKYGLSKSHIAARIHLLVDLKFLEKKKIKSYIYQITHMGAKVVGHIPVLSPLETGASRDFINIDTDWIQQSIFKTICSLLCNNNKTYGSKYTNWDSRSKEEKIRITHDILPKMFDHFVISKSVPKLWLDISWLYFCIRSTVDHYTPIDYDDFCVFMNQCPIIDGYKYEIRINESVKQSYLLRNPLQLF